MTADVSGNFWGTQDSSAGGNVARDTVQGTSSVNADCTGRATVNLYDPAGNLPRRPTYATVYVDNVRELRGIMTSLVLPDGTGVRAVMTLEAERTFPDRCNED